MSDNTTINSGSGGDTITTDDLATLNGSAVGTPQKVQRVKVGYGADGDLRDVDPTHGLPVVVASVPVKIADTTVAWANSAPANTEKTVDLAPSATHLASRDILVVIRSPSSVTAISVIPKSTFTDPNGGATRYAKLNGGSFTVAVIGGAPDDGGESFPIYGALVTGGCRLSLKNATVLGGSDGFTASIQVWQL